MASERTYVSCPNGCGNIITERYRDIYGQCESCYLPIGAKVNKAFGNRH